jgi:ubiquinone/menaquinone biosynthesis C-methylase UbiE
MPIPTKYSALQVWIQDRLVAERSLPLHAYILEHTKLAALLSEKKERRLLDVGCGGGQPAIRLLRGFPHLRITGIDLSEAMIAAGQRRARSSGIPIELMAGDAQAMPFPDGAYDIVLSFGSAKHWPEPLKGIGECWRVLRPGGALLISDATSDATLQEVRNFVRLAGFPNLLTWPMASVLSWRMFRPARPLRFYRQIAQDLRMPSGTVGKVPSMPAFLFWAQKPSE